VSPLSVDLAPPPVRPPGRGAAVVLWGAIEPIVVWLAPLLLAAPLLFLFVGSFARSWDSRGLSGVTLANMAEAFEAVRESIVFSWMLALGTAIIATAIAVPLAYATRTSSHRLGRFLGGMVDLPVILPALLLAMGLMLAYPFLQGGWIILLIAHVVQTLPFAMWPVVSALSVLDVATLDTAGRTLGASPFQRLTLLVLPNVWRSALTGAATSFVLSFSETGSSLFLGSPYYRPIGVVLVDSFINQDQRISAAAAVLFILCLLPALAIIELTLGNGRKRSKARTEATSSHDFPSFPKINQGGNA